MRIKAIFYGLIYMAALFAVHGHASAEEAKAKPAADIIKKVEAIDPAAEGLGLIRYQSEGALSSNLWNGLDRAAIQKLFYALTPPSKNKAEQALWHGVMLSETNISSIDGKDKPEPGEDLLTLRLEHLIRGGHFDAAYKLYNKLDDKPYTAKLAQMGILAALFKGEKSLACIEAQSVRKGFMDQSFFTEILGWCNIGLGDADEKSVQAEATSPLLQDIEKNSDYSFSYDRKKYEQLSLSEQAILVADNRIDAKSLDRALAAKLPAFHVMALLNNNRLDVEQRFTLLLSAYEYGLKTRQDIEGFYASAIMPAAGEKSPALPEKDKMENWLALASLYLETQNISDDSEKNRLLKDILQKSSPYNSASLVPFISFFESFTPKAEDISWSDLARIYKIFIFSENKIPSTWIGVLENKPLDDDDQNYAFKLYVLAAANHPNTLKSKENQERYTQAQSKSSKRYKKFMNKVIENIDKGKNVGHNAIKIYDKDFDLTLTNNYVMPSTDVWDRLSKARQNKSIGETALLCLVILGNDQAKTIYPGLFADILQTLTTVGLTDISHDLAISAILEDIT